MRTSNPALGVVAICAAAANESQAEDSDLFKQLAARASNSLLTRFSENAFVLFGLRLFGD